MKLKHLLKELVAVVEADLIFLLTALDHRIKLNKEKTDFNFY